MSADSKRGALASSAESFADTFKVSHETIHRLERLVDLLEHWQKTTNLVAPSTLPDVWGRHLADSAQLSGLAPKARLWLDLGSGGGFPGLVVAILRSGDPDFRMHLVESNHKKCAFLGQAVRAVQAPVDIHAMRIEQFAENAQSLRPDVVSARALAPLPRLLELAEPFLRGETRGLFLKGRETEAEIASAQDRWSFGHVCHPSLTADDAWVVQVTNLRRRPA
ncbi:16S rRNA (guanine(527)-N(7))-methyltransferase RsmG [Methyloceanibacter caenitepidi]|uniref:Ribosomal RNA small subunit methyltransferase G n=1 Tax=Methyloceanibacter caenitepidi TaxID=1384459 RepID=A0A0A8K1E0_9HYPH|nr:16S rRNA (guanine(527)-N(7))-methyltransferase RsmG [Methyloceanibacter caenitepidi]BAQ15799.1 rRNA small subunit 7-methylguanosine (m7G) methyltransferase GidB [Methyloceanibacter caenitepidi]